MNKLTRFPSQHQTQAFRSFVSKTTLETLLSISCSNLLHNPFFYFGNFLLIFYRVVSCVFRTRLSKDTIGDLVEPSADSHKSSKQKIHSRQNHTTEFRRSGKTKNRDNLNNLGCCRIFRCKN